MMPFTTAPARLIADGDLLRDEHARHRILHGMNLISKGSQRTEGDFAERGFAGDWTDADIVDLAQRGFTLVRFGVIWAAVEPAPGEYDEQYLDWVATQLDSIHSAGLSAILDSHQDLYSQAFGDGAPRWATLTEHEYTPTTLWSDAYLASPAVQQSLDSFWANAPGPGGVGLQDRYAAMWAHLARRFRDHPAVVGYDLLNEPTPGSSAAAIFETLIGAFAQVTGQDPQQVLADFSDPEGKFSQLAHLDDEQVHRQVGDILHPLVAAFETEAVAPFMTRVAAAVREQDPDALILREHSYFANIGIPSGQPELDDVNWAYSPHGYDLTVDTEATALSSNVRAGTIFSRHAETADRLGVPVIVGEWGALSLGPGVSDHARHLQDVFDAHGWSWTYWCWEKGFAGSEAVQALTRPRPVAFAGTGLEWSATESTLRAHWRGEAGSAPSLFFAPGGEVSARRDGEPIAAERDGVWVAVPAGEGDHHLTIG